MAYHGRNPGNVPPHNPNYGSNPARHHQDGYPEGRNWVGKTEGNRHGGHREDRPHGGTHAGHQRREHHHGVDPVGHGYGGHPGGYHREDNPGRPRPGGYLPGHDHGGYPAGHYHEESDARTIYDQEMQTQAQEQIQKQRTLQASAQMLYDGYENTMGMIEELEKHEGHNMSAGFSGLMTHVIPKGTKKPKRDVTAIIEAQLTCLDGQMTFAPPEVTRAARMKLLEKTLKWVAARGERGIEPSPVDAYTKNVVQVLIKPDSLKFPERERDPRAASLDERTVNELMFAFAQAQHKGDLQDKEFEANPDKKASLRKMREGEDLHSGATRLVNLDPKDGEFYQVLAASLQHLDAYAKGDLR